MLSNTVVNCIVQNIGNLIRHVNVSETKVSLLSTVRRHDYKALDSTVATLCVFIDISNIV